VGGRAEISACHAAVGSSPPANPELHVGALRRSLLVPNFHPLPLFTAFRSTALLPSSIIPTCTPQSSSAIVTVSVEDDLASAAGSCGGAWPTFKLPLRRARHSTGSAPSLQGAADPRGHHPELAATSGCGQEHDQPEGCGQDVPELAHSGHLGASCAIRWVLSAMFHRRSRACRHRPSVVYRGKPRLRVTSNVSRVKDERLITSDRKSAAC